MQVFNSSWQITFSSLCVAVSSCSYQQWCIIIIVIVKCKLHCRFRLQIYSLWYEDAFLIIERLQILRFNSRLFYIHFSINLFCTYIILRLKLKIHWRFIKKDIKSLLNLQGKRNRFKIWINVRASWLLLLTCFYQAKTSWIIGSEVNDYPKIRGKLTFRGSFPGKDKIY